MSDLTEHEIPAEITTYSAVVTKDNVDSYLDVGPIRDRTANQ